MVARFAGGGSASSVTSGWADGIGSASTFSFPTGIASSPVDGTLYVADNMNNIIRRISPTGTRNAIFTNFLTFELIYFTSSGVVTRLAGGGSAGGVASGSIDGTGSTAKFWLPFGVAVSSSGTVYVSDCNNNLIRTLSPTGTDIAILSKARYFSVVVT